MEYIQSINPSRLTWCCNDMGITPHDLASTLGISKTNIDRTISGESCITFNQLKKIAEYFGRGVLFFLEPEPADQTKIHTPQFRSLANQKPELTQKLRLFIERVERQKEIYLSLIEESSSIDTTSFKPPKFTSSNIEETAKITRKWLGLGSTNDFESYRAAVESKGILVFRSNGYNGKWQISKESPIMGFTLYDKDCPVIVVKKEAFSTRQSFTLMHELGHVLLHKISSIDDYQDLYSYKGMEREASLFAANILVPTEFLNEIDDQSRPENPREYDSWLKKFRDKWGVSTDVVLIRLIEANRLKQNQYDAYAKWQSTVKFEEGGGTRQYRYREPTHIFGDRFVTTILDSLNTKKITLTKASTYLDNLKITDLYKLKNYYEGT